MNQRNVEALTAILERCLDAPSGTAGLLARALSNAGVLVPSALTDREANDIGRQQVHHTEVDNFGIRNAEAVRAEMERIAKGQIE